MDFLHLGPDDIHIRVKGMARICGRIVVADFSRLSTSQGQ